MRRFKLFWVLLPFLLSAYPASAQEFSGEDIDGFIGLGFGEAFHSSDYLTNKSVTRQAFKLEFARLSSNVSVDLIYATGGGYSTFGGRFNVFRPIPIPQNGSNFVLLPGLGFEAARCSSGLYRAANETGPTTFTDLSLGPVLRAMYDFKMGLAVSLDFHYDFMLDRVWSGGSPKNQSSPADHVAFVGFTLMMDSRLIE